MKHDITPRQLEVLLASYFNQPSLKRRPSPRSGDEHTATEIWWLPSHGNASRRMIQRLRDLGYLTEYYRHEDFGDKSSDDLTAKGYEALAERHSTLPPGWRRLVLQSELATRLSQRRAREDEIERLRHAKIEETRRIGQERVAKRREELIGKMRAVLADFRVDVADQSDDWLLELHERIASL